MYFLKIPLHDNIQNTVHTLAPDRTSGTERSLCANEWYTRVVDNPENPYSPPQPIKWGRESNDEMGAVTVQVVAKDERDRPELQRVVSKSLTDSARSFFQRRIFGAAGKGDDVIDANKSQTALQ